MYFLQYKWFVRVCQEKNPPPKTRRQPPLNKRKKPSRHTLRTRGKRDPGTKQRISHAPERLTQHTTVRPQNAHPKRHKHVTNFHPRVSRSPASANQLYARRPAIGRLLFYSRSVGTLKAPGGDMTQPVVQTSFEKVACYCGEAG